MEDGRKNRRWQAIGSRVGKSEMERRQEENRATEWEKDYSATLDPRLSNHTMQIRSRARCGVEGNERASEVNDKGSKCNHPLTAAGWPQLKERAAGTMDEIFAK